MNSNAVSILTDPHPCGHIVYPYTDESQVAEAVVLFASAGLRKGEAVLLVMTRDHCEPIRQRLQEAGFDLALLEGNGQLVCERAEDMLSSFLVDGNLDEQLFKTIISGMIERAQRAGGNRRVRVFGEMVSLLWQANSWATQRLEELWNEVIEAHSVPLLCAYALAGTRRSDFPKSLLALHSHAVA